MSETKEMVGAVVVTWTEDGDVIYTVCGDERVRLFIVDERSPNDRVYEWVDRSPPETLREIIRDDEIGHKNDARHAAIEAKLIAALEGKPHLKPV